MLLPLGELGRQPGFDVYLTPGYGPITEDEFKGSDVIAAQRIHSFNLWDYLGSGSKLVYESDDDYFSILPENKFAYAEYQNPWIREETARCLARSDLVTVTTEYLADVMREHNPNVAVLPNYIPDWVPDLPVETRGVPCVGWAGGASHERNVAMAVGPLRRFLKRNAGWGMKLVGTDYRHMFGNSRCAFAPWVDITARPTEYYSALNFDIGIAPLLDNAFNRCKSPLRVMEYAARGIPVVASDVVPYQDFIEDGVTGFLVHRESEWLDRVSELAADDSLRVKMGAAAQAKVRAGGAGWEPWASAYRSL